MFSRSVDLRWLSFAFGLLAVGCQSKSGSPTSGSESAGRAPAPAGPELQHEDYAQARAHFRTQLLRRGPAPQPYEETSAPPMATEVEYSRGLKAWLSKRGAAKSPAVLFLHGGFSFGQDDWDMTRPFRDAGFIVMTPILRAENGQSGSYSLFYDEVDDVLAAAEYLAKVPYVDPSHLYVAGHSVGGTLTLLAALSSNRFRAAAAFSGSADQSAFLKGQAELAPFDPSNVRELMLRSPLAYAESFKCPTRLFCGAQELVFAEGGRRTARLAKAKGLDVEAVVVPGDHFSTVPEEMTQAIRFFQQR